MSKKTAYGNEIARFTAGRKSFFFNEQESKSGDSYLAINTLWGQGNRERIILFPNQLPQFYKAVLECVTHFTNLRPAETLEEPLRRCKECEEPRSQLGVLLTKDREDWLIYCKRCTEVQLESREGVLDQIKEERDDWSS